MLLTTVRRNSARRSAFTLLEVLVVVAILVILAGVASISIFRYMEDAKVSRAKSDMQAIEKAYETFYTQHQEWPQDLIQVAPLLKQGQEALKDPWGNPYVVEIVEYQDPTDGQTIQRPVVRCQPPGNKPVIQWPEK
jgi:general secretion pathway protein G